MSCNDRSTSTVWYAAHLLLVLEEEGTVARHRTVWEQIHLIEAASVSEAFDKADAIGREIEELDRDSGHTSDGRPARWVFAGVRRLAECIDFDNGPPADRAEATYIEYTVRSMEDIDGLLRGEAALVVIENTKAPVEEVDRDHPELPGG